MIWVIGSTKFKEHNGELAENKMYIMAGLVGNNIGETSANNAMPVGTILYNFY